MTGRATATGGVDHRENLFGRGLLAVSISTANHIHPIYIVRHHTLNHVAIDHHQVAQCVTVVVHHRMCTPLMLDRFFFRRTGRPTIASSSARGLATVADPPVRRYGGLKDQDRIFTNVYCKHDHGIKGAKVSLSELEDWSISFEAQSGESRRACA